MGTTEPAAFSPDSQAVLISVAVPEGSQVFVNGNRTTSMGPERTFISRGLEPGRRYKYEVQAEIERDGKMVKESKIVFVTAGDHSRLIFGEQAAEEVASEPADNKTADAETSTAETPVTTLKLRVPDDAKVTLSGAETRSAGPLRIFATNRLAPGKTWDNYVVRAEVKRDGKTVTREATISLAAGETRELSLDFNSEQVAATTAHASR